MDKELFGDDLERFEDEREAQAEETERRMREEKKARPPKLHNECSNPDSKRIEPIKPNEKLDKNLNSEGMRHHIKYLDFDPHI